MYRCLLSYLALLLVVGLSHAAVQVDPKDQPVLDAFLKHARIGAKSITVEHCKSIATPETFCWVQLPKLNMSLTAYELTGDAEHLRDFVAGFENLRSIMIRGSDEFLGWYGKPIPSLIDPAKPDVSICEIQTDFRAVAVLARFVEIVQQDEALSKEFTASCTTYLELMQDHLVKKWDVNGYYAVLPDGAAVYRWNRNYIPNKAGITLSHEKQSIMIEALLNLWRVTGKTEYRDKAVALGTFLKNCLKETDGHYTWTFWDRGGEWDEADGKLKHWIGPEPQGVWFAATVGSAVNLHRNNVVFHALYIQKFLRTQMDVCWNGDVANPKFKMVDGSTPKSTERFVAPSLAAWSPKLRELLYAGAWQEERLAKANDPWHGGVIAGEWLRGKYLVKPTEPADTDAAKK